jgi:F0F1-type ATP synthase membrane subunit a
MQNIILSSPMEQYNIYTVIPYIGIEINNVVFALIISLMLSMAFLYIGLAKDEIKLNSWSVISETMYHTNLRIVSTYIGNNNRIYFPLLYTIFYLILFSNLLGLIPYSTTSTAEFVITLTITSTMLLGILIIGYQN